MYGVSVEAGSAPECVGLIQQAENAGVGAAWTNMGAAGPVDMMPVLAAAGAQTERIMLGNAIVHTWSRQPAVFAEEALAIEQLAPGRYRLGIGPSTAFFVERMYGASYTKPLTNLREYLTTVRALVNEGSVKFKGEHVSLRWRLLGEPTPLPVMASALRPKSYSLCGELADGAISWMSPLKYLSEVALPALEEGAKKAERETPPLVAHVPVAVTTDRDDAFNRAREQVGYYAEVPNYQGMFAMAGYDVSGGYTDEMLEDLVVWGTEDEVVEKLQRWTAGGMSEVIASTLYGADREESIASVFSAVARASK
ncbi:MAG: LLM class flavin-dependent oxidoreductase [Geminicoccus sp.]|nr:LLM class flavin-dependent oxidoreductase [Geminicoccus sp.]